jgi:SAM-dependent methyltransferase
MRRRLQSLWVHPAVRGRDLDDPRTIEARRAVIASKPMLRRIYAEWYDAICQAVPPGGEPVVEIGSGAGFLADLLPGVVTSEVQVCSGVRVVLDGCELPFGDASLRGIVMTNVFHHLPDVERFLGDAARTVRVDGVVVMIEPWVSRWSRFVYSRLHHEPFDVEATEWRFPSSGPLSGANGALPWIVFERDRSRFERRFPEWAVRRITPVLPLRYLLSGGVSLRSVVPAATGRLWQGVERALQPWISDWAMFAVIELVRQPPPAFSGRTHG